MKKICFIAAIVLLGTLPAIAQQSSVSKGQLAKAGVDKKMASLDYSKLFLKKITLSASQQTQVNSIFAAFMQSKRAMYVQNRKDPAAYQSKQDALLAKLKTDLSAVLSNEQMTVFLASKPKQGDKADYLTVVFY
jgi:hypothetical protein